MFRSNAGYLHWGTRTEGAKVGAAAGLLAAVPIFAVAGLVLGVLSFGVIVGGYLGVALRDRTDGDGEFDDDSGTVDSAVETTH